MMVVIFMIASVIMLMTTIFFLAGLACTATVSDIVNSSTEAIERMRRQAPQPGQHMEESRK